MSLPQNELDHRTCSGTHPAGAGPGIQGTAPSAPNILVIVADDLGFGDVGCYGASHIPTPNIDRLAQAGLRLTNAHATSAVCTPSRYSLLTGEYAWRRPGTGILPGDAALVIPTSHATLPSILKKAGYRTGVVGKWHLGLGGDGGPDWNGDITPGPNEVGFDYSFIMPATGDRVPCVYVENHRVHNLVPADPIHVSFGERIGDEPTGLDHPEMLKVRPSHGHNQTIINGISRIGYMTGGKAARWVDEEMADTITGKAVDFIERNKVGPFFLYFATHDPHVPRAPHPRFVGKSGCGIRGDAIVEFDWCVGALLDALDHHNLAANTIVIVTSDNGPVVDDGYDDGAVAALQGHRPAGLLRGGKYSIFEGGTRIPFVLRWPGRVKPDVTDALISLVDLPASFAALTGQSLGQDDCPDSLNMLPALLGDSHAGRKELVEHAEVLALLRGDVKMIQPGHGPKVNAATNTELGADPEPQLYDLAADLGEKTDLAGQFPERVTVLDQALNAIRDAGRSRP